MAMPERHKTTIQSFQIPQVEEAINATIFGATNQSMARDVFVGDMTYEQAAEVYNMSVSGFHKHMRKIRRPMENYLQKLN